MDSLFGNNEEDPLRDDFNISHNNYVCLTFCFDSHIISSEKNTTICDYNETLSSITPNTQIKISQRSTKKKAKARNKEKKLNKCDDKLVSDINVSNKCPIVAIKVRGGYKTLQEAEKRAKYLGQTDAMPIWVGEIGKWLPLKVPETKDKEKKESSSVDDPFEVLKECSEVHVAIRKMEEQLLQSRVTQETSGTANSETNDSTNLVANDNANDELVADNADDELIANDNVDDELVADDVTYCSKLTSKDEVNHIPNVDMTKQYPELNKIEGQMGDDLVIPGQLFVTLSFITPSKIMDHVSSILSESKSSEHLPSLSTDAQRVVGLKIRGIHADLEEAEKIAETIRKSDPWFDVCIGVVGRWLPWDNSSQTEDERFDNEQLDATMKELREAEKNATTTTNTETTTTNTETTTTNTETTTNEIENVSPEGVNSSDIFSDNNFTNDDSDDDNEIVDAVTVMKSML